MFVAALLFLTLLAALLQGLRSDSMSPSDTHVFWWCLVLVYPLFVAELGLHIAAGSLRWRMGVVHCLLPPLRLATRDHASGETIWLPFLGRQIVNRQLQRRVERAFDGPMIVIALMILPLLAIEYFWQQQLRTHVGLAFALDTATSVIWMAFAIEFLVMISLVRRKVRYCQQHWVDLLIICLPLVSFLRLLRLGALLRMYQVSRLTRLYRARGLALRAFRALVLLEFVQRVIHFTPQRRLRTLRELLEEREEEVEELRAEIRQLEEKIDLDAK